MTKVLIVDDSKFSQKITYSLLNQYLENIEFLFANDGQEGLEKFSEVHPDFMIVDLLMPKLRGQDLIEKAKQIDREANVIVLSADVQNRVRDVVEKMGVLSFINKPLDEKKAKEICDIIGTGSRGR
ncbi:response regulator [Sporolactobacillus shoreicorticis]|uniref:Response regulator transcription factor n=1 Tax=Sporolactobacillus shoreicorticis TaxID=1923877 RepID=A0ABW5S498_9BACL|nr:response regulator [Sporolactobacillus shoreicorticis]MCO7125837.1 response regulator [Sporolactobacillus shoreicorticis]